MTTFTTITVTTNCAGQQCPQRDKCVRYQQISQPNTRWASLDLERQVYGSCPAYMPIEGSKRRANK